MILCQARDLNDKATFIRIEELAPFPFLNLYSSAVHFTWLQEEPRNQGAWNHVRGRFETVLSARKSLKNGIIELHHWDERRARCLLQGSGRCLKSNSEALLNRHFHKWKKRRRKSKNG
jgi:2-oxoglutarate dehydrogenase complex dehydrogenase (E1) component-like enzyme